jgi:hypothetical protein
MEEEQHLKNGETLMRWLSMYSASAHKCQAVTGENMETFCTDYQCPCSSPRHILRISADTETTREVLKKIISTYQMSQALSPLYFSFFLDGDSGQP